MADTNERIYSGELFDLSIPSTNSIFGAMHNLGIMQYGINFPLSKFIKELEMIIKGEADDKTAKRQQRLDFLKHCNSNKELQQFFILFCNLLNGKDGDGTQWSNYMVITAAGGNIMILFAQLIKNIIDNNVEGTQLMSSNKTLLENLARLTGTTEDIIKESIIGHFTDVTILEEIAESEPSDCDFKLSPNIIPLIDTIPVDVITKMLQELEVSPIKGGNGMRGGVKFDAANTAFPFGAPNTAAADPISAFPFGAPNTAAPFGASTFGTQYRGPSDTDTDTDSQNSNMITNRPGLVGEHSESDMGSDMESRVNQDKHYLIILTSIMENLRILKISQPEKEVEESPEEIFKKSQEEKEAEESLKETLHTLEDLLEKMQINEKPEEEMEIEIDSKLGEFLEVVNFLYDNIKLSEEAGFLLYRIKTVIECIIGFKALYNPKKIQEFRKNCSEKHQKLYPQIIQQEHLKDVPTDSNCFKYLTYLLNKKKAIKWLTTMASEEIIKYQKEGALASNDTDALINYIKTLTKNMNSFIQLWQTGSLLHHSAPGYHDVNTLFQRNGSNLSTSLSYISICKSFASLKTIVQDNNGLIPMLCGDILLNFLNSASPKSEDIVDKILGRFNSERRLAHKTTGVMKPSSLLLVPSLFSKDLEASKDILQKQLDKSKQGIFGYPDGVRITINAIESDSLQAMKELIDIVIGMDLYGLNLYDEDSYKKNSDSKKRVPLHDRPDIGGRKNTTFKNKLKNTKCKLKTCKKYFKKKSRKHKSRKHKSRKHKSRKHKFY
jgi:hypothetical protein